ncbi:MAG: hypothetical protein QOH26_1319 [Actinomycetota bacterium]|nr:hypothetical protein [Actinomycetota bacterium]
MHRNLKTPVLKKRLAVVSPEAIVLSLDHDPFHAVTVCVVPVGFFHTMRSPFTILLTTGSQDQSPDDDPAALNRCVSASDVAGRSKAPPATTITSMRTIVFTRPPSRESLLRSLLGVIREGTFEGLPNLTIPLRSGHV